MDLLNLQTEVIESVAVESEANVNELLEAQLALVGGGIGNCELG